MLRSHGEQLGWLLLPALDPLTDSFRLDEAAAELLAPKRDDVGVLFRLRRE